MFELQVFLLKLQLIFCLFSLRLILQGRSCACMIVQADEASITFLDTQSQLLFSPSLMPRRRRTCKDYMQTGKQFFWNIVFGQKSKLLRISSKGLEFLYKSRTFDIWLVTPYTKQNNSCLVETQHENDMRQKNWTHTHFCRATIQYNCLMCCNS